MTAGASVAFVLNLGAALPIVALFVSAFLGAYVFGLNPRGPANRSVLLVMIAFVVWDVGEVVQRSLAPGTSPDVLFFWARVTWVAIAFVPATLYQLALTYPTKADWIRRPWALAAIYVPALAWASLISMTGLVINGMSSNAFGPSARVAPTYAYLAPVFFVWMFTSVMLFVRSWWQVRKTPSRWVFGVVLLGLIAGTVPAAVTELLWPILSSNDTRVGLGSLYTLMWSIFIAYAVLRYRYLVIEPGTAVLLDDLDYLATLAGFDAVARFLKRVTNQASASKGTVIVSAGFGTFPPEQIALLRGSVDRVLEVQEAIASSTPGAEHVLMTINAQDAPVALPLVGARRGLLLTTEHPTKARLRYGDRFDIVWVTEQPEPGVPCVRPNALDTEGRRAIGNYATAHEGMDIVLVGLEQLALYVDLRSWLPFVKDSLDIASLHGCRLFLTVAPEALSPQELAVLARRFDTGLSPSMFKGSAPSGPTTAAPENRIPYREPSA